MTLKNTVVDLITVGVVAIGVGFTTSSCFIDFDAFFFKPGVAFSY